MRQHRYDDTRKTALKAARDGGMRARSLACNYAVIGVQTRILPFGHSIHLEVFVPSLPLPPHIFLSKRQNPRDRRKGTN